MARKKRKQYDPSKTIRSACKGIELYCTDFNPSSTDLDPNDLEIRRKGLPVTMTQMRVAMNPKHKFRWFLTCGVTFYSEYHKEEITEELEIEIGQQVTFDELNTPFKEAYAELERQNPNFKLIKRFWKAEVIQ